MNLNNILANSLLGQLKNKNPESYKSLMSLMNSGKNPEQVLNELLANGTFTQEQVNAARAAAMNQQLPPNQNGNRKRF